MLSRHNEVTVDTLARRLKVSMMTVRRDLAHLARQGKLSRTHGGALLSRVGVAEFAFRDKADLMTAEKQAIAREVARMIEPGMAVSLDTGTTTLEVAKLIGGLRDVTILTTSLAVASVLHTSDGIELLLLGGTVRKNSPDLTGALAEENLKRFRTHLAVVGADAITPDGTFTTDVRISRVSRAMVKNADTVVLASDHSKFEQTALVQVASFNEIDSLVTDNGCPRNARKWLTKAVARVIYARVGTR